MSLRGLDTDSFLELEESIAGKPGGRWVTPSNNTQLSLLAISLALACGLFGGMLEGFLPNGFFELVTEAEAEGEEDKKDEEDEEEVVEVVVVEEEKEERG